MKPIAFYPQLALELGDIASAIYYQQLYYWSDKGAREDGFIYKTMKEIEEETTLTRDQQDRIKKNLIKLGWLEVKKIKANGAPTLHYRCLAGIELICGKPTNRNAGNPQMQSIKTRKSITENTTENTTDININTTQSVERNTIIAELIFEFKDVNPSYKTLFSRSPQRKAIERLLETYGEEKLRAMIKFLPINNRADYAVIITTPTQLENNLGRMKAFWEKKSNQPKKTVKII